MTRPPPESRRAGILVPLFSIPSTGSWGIGEIGDIERLARWLESAGQRFVQLLPINELPPLERSPYSALSAMAIDPQFITMNSLEDFEAIGGEPALDPQVRKRLDSVRLAGAVRYDDVRALKNAVLHRTYTHFRDREWRSGTRRASAFRTFTDSQDWWLDDYALYRALKARHGESAWTDWPEPLRTRQPAALDAARQDLADDIQFRKYVQWIAGDQWGEARDRAQPIALFGDLPFMVSVDSADVWARQDEFRLDASVGVPPDAFSSTGQDWGLPVYKWEVFAARNFDWLRDRARRNADLYDGYRVDHLVGFYRTYFRPHDGTEPRFTPTTQEAQVRLGEEVLGVFRAPGAEIIAEDLGVVPDFVRESLERLAVPGYKVFRWEREWSLPDQPFKDPQRYPSVSVATSGTHDTEPLAIWWQAAPRGEREAALQTPPIARRITGDERQRVLENPELSNHCREAFLEALFESGSDLLILPIQDVYGWCDRINQPATVGDGNWTWRLPWPVDRLTTEPEAMDVANQLREWSTKHRR